jgi:hypothetical protein
LVEAGKVSLSTTTFAKNEVGVRVAGGEVAVSGVTVTGGAAGKAAVDVASGTLKGDKLEVRAGAGIGLRVSAGTATLTNSVFSNRSEEGVVVSGGAVTLEGAKVQGNARGLKVTGGQCTLEKESQVNTNTQLGVQVTSGTLALTDSEVLTNGQGLEQSGGTTTIVRVPIKSNAGNGVKLTEGTLRIADGDVAQNGLTGIEASGVSSTLKLERTKVRGNGAGGATASVAGLLLQNNPVVEGVTASQFTANAGAQIRVSGTTPVDLSSSSCASPNVVGCYDPAKANGVQVIGTAKVTMSYTLWRINPPLPPEDYTEGVVIAPTCGTAVCN